MDINLFFNAIIVSAQLQNYTHIATNKKQYRSVMVQKEAYYVNIMYEYNTGRIYVTTDFILYKSFSNMEETLKHISKLL